MGIVLVLGLMIGGYFIPEDRRLSAMAERDVAAAGEGPVSLSGEHGRRVRIEEAVGHVAGLLVIAAVCLMVAKPGL